MLSELAAPLQAYLRRYPRQVAAAAVAAFFLVVILRAPSIKEFGQFTVLGVATGCLFAIAASGIVLTYATTGVFNFAHGAVGMVATYVYWLLAEEAGLAKGLAMALAVLAVAPAVGLLFERIMRSFRDSPPGTTITVTIALTILLIGAAQSLFPSTGEQRTLDYLFGNRVVTILDARVPWDKVLFLVLAVAIAVLLRLLLFTSRTGVAMRAVVDNANLAALNGAPPVTIARYSWVLGSSLAALGGVLFIGEQRILEPIVLPFFVLNAYGAAVFGRLRSLPLTFAGAILLGLVKEYQGFLLPKGDFWSNVGPSIEGVFLFVALLLLPQAKLSVGRVVGRDTPRVPGLRSSLVRCVPFLAVVAIAPQFLGNSLPDVTKGLIFATLMLSLVLLTGYSGQISLAQYVYFALGAWAMGSVGDGDTLLGLGAAAAAAIPFGIATALPAMRLQGLYLALVTFAVAVVSNQLILGDKRIFGEQNVVVGRLELFGLDFGGNHAFFFLCGLVFAAVGVAVLALRRGGFGRRLAAIRDSEAACATLGLDVRRTKLVVFCLSAAIAGLAGAMFGGLVGSVGTIAFDPIYNVTLFLFAFVGGITTVTGALLGGMVFALLPYLQSKAANSSGLTAALPGLLSAAVAVTALLLGKQPNGMAGQLYERVARWRAASAVSARERAASARPTTTREVSVGTAS